MTNLSAEIQPCYFLKERVQHEENSFVGRISTASCSYRTAKNGILESVFIKSRRTSRVL